MKKKNIVILLFLDLLMVLICSKANIFGSTMDFLNQHIIFPEYLRNTFYETGKLIPSFAINIGAGQNIYNIAYYGLLNPIIILSYLFPFIKMIDYIIFMNITLFILSNILFYKFINSKFDDKISLLLSILFALSGPLIFQFHRQFMFVNYMPFLILSLINIDNNKKLNLIINILLIILISFYYSIPSIIVILIYYFYKNYNKLEIKDIIKMLLCILTSILMSMILILPTFYAILTSRNGFNDTNILALLIPNINLDNILYSSYSPGLTSILIISLLYLLMKKSKKNIFLFIIIFTLSFMPLSLYLLNGGLYTRSKALIPFLPLFILIIGIFINDLFNKKINIKKLIIYILIANIIILINYHTLAYYLDLIFMVILILINNKKIFSISLVLLNITICICQNNTENYINRELYQKTFKNIPKLETNYRTINLNNNNETINKVYNNNYYTTSIYSSTINKYYSNLYHNIFKVNNPYINNLELGSSFNILFNKYMGVKYVVSDEHLEYPYKKISNNLYEIESNPIAYVTSYTMNKEYYENLNYPYNLDLLLNYIIDENNNKPTSNIKKKELDYDYELGKNIKIEGKKIIVSSEDNITIKLKENLKNKILFIDIYGLIENEKDIKMTINGQSNLLTKKNWIYPNHNNIFHYCLNNVSDKLDITLTPGIYNIDSINTFILDDINLLEIDPLNINEMNTEKIKGNIKVTKDGIFVLKIPYDKGFNIKVNGVKTDYKLINDTFMGFNLKKGIYNIEITYNPPLLKEGKILSLIGIGIFIFGIVYKNKKTNYN
ncbi:MAG: YfhO family protein [Bacilli bacterium]|nr:YfhO family protein [Bacilli bacterium]